LETFSAKPEICSRVRPPTVGIAVRVPGGFMFFASADEFNELDGRLFRRARAIERQLQKVARAKGRRRALRKFLPAI
jgi:hypothetical protein